MPDRRPIGCACIQETWPSVREIPPVCRVYDAPHKKSGKTHCRDCGHDVECHDGAVPRNPYFRRRMHVEILRTS